MKNKIREKFIASVMLSAFVVTNSVTGAFAMNDFYLSDNSSRPMIRSSEVETMDINSGVKISNADSVVNLSLRDADVRQVLRMFADQAGMNIIFASQLQGTVTMDLVDVPLEEALNLVVSTNNLFYDIKANTLVISTKEEALSVASKGMTMIPVKYVNAAALASFLNTNIFSKNNMGPGMSNKQAVTINPATNELIIVGTPADVALARKIVEQFDKKPTVTTFKVNHTTPAEMADLICSTLLPSTISSGSTGSGSSSGGSAGASSGGGSSSSAASGTGTAAGFAAGMPTGFASDEGGEDSSSSSGDGGNGSITVGGGKLLCSAESSVSSDEGGIEGLPFKNLSVAYFPTQGTVQIIGGSQSQIDMIREYIAENDKKTPQAYLEVQIISLSETGSKTFDNTWQFLSKNFSFNAGGGKGFATDPMYPVFFAGHGYTLVDSESWDDDKGAYETIGKVAKWSSSPQLVYSVNYLIENRKGRVLANPRVLLTSGQPSTIDLTSDYVAKVTSQYLDSTSGAGSAQVQKEYEIKNDNGIKVTITPFISPDGYVTLDIAPNYSTIKEQLYATGETGDRDLAATLLQRRNLSLKGLRIKDGETLVIGGMIQETENKTVTKIPFLGDLPVIGMFFRSTGTEKVKEEMVMMLTPQILVDTEDAVGDDTAL